MIVNLSGQGGAGKSTLARFLQSEVPLRYRVLVPYTTRPMRPGELDGVDYHFVPSGQLADTAAYTLRRVRGNDVYAVRRDDLQERSHILLTTFPPRGVMMLRQDGYRVVCCHLDLDEPERIRRMIARGDRCDAAIERARLDAGESSLVSTRAVLGDVELFVFDARKPVAELARAIDNQVKAIIALRDC